MSDDEIVFADAMLRERRKRVGKPAFDACAILDAATPESIGLTVRLAAAEEKIARLREWARSPVLLRSRDQAYGFEVAQDAVMALLQEGSP